MLCGDHALKKNIEFIAPKLLDNPDILDSLENALRKTVFDSRRKYILQCLGNQPSFALVKISCNDIKKFDTCFGDLSFDRFVKKYRSSLKKKKGFSIKNPKFTKTIDDVKKLKGIMTTMEHEENYHICPDVVLDPSVRNEDNIIIALNRGIIIRSGTKHVVLDGTHRLVAYYWSRHLKKKKILPKKCICILLCCHMSQIIFNDLRP